MVRTILLIAALLPAVLLMIRVYRLDRIEKEPNSLLVKLFLFGALSAVPASLAELFLIPLLKRLIPDHGLFFLAVQNFLIVALTEEICKRFPVRRLVWNHPAFDYRFDAVVYCVFSALGFAALENIGYVMQFGLRTALARAVLSVPGHFFFAVGMGICLGTAKQAEAGGQTARRSFMLILSLILPVALHGFWDFCLTVNSWLTTGLFYVFVAVFFFCAARILRRASMTDQPVCSKESFPDDLS